MPDFQKAVVQLANDYSLTCANDDDLLEQLDDIDYTNEFDEAVFSILEKNGTQESYYIEGDFKKTLTKFIKKILKKSGASVIPPKINSSYK